jgi:hypothetical protein
LYPFGHPTPYAYVLDQTNLRQVFLSCGEDGVVKGIDLRCEKQTDMLTTREDGKKVPLYR